VIEIRRATPEDTEELIRLRAVMIASMSGQEPEPDPWQEAAGSTLRRWLSDPDGDHAAFVVDIADDEGKDGLAACALGHIEQVLQSPWNHAGVSGYIYNVVTDPGHRRLGYSRACMQALVGWFYHRGAASVRLAASEVGEPLYESLGFVRSDLPSMRLALPPQCANPG
jgi:GNAT superfamily N-acetyltransferase